MCISYPGEVIGLDGGQAWVGTEGRARRASTLAMPDTAVGDWVIVAAGAIVRRLEPNEAAEIARMVRIATGEEGNHHDRTI